MADGNNPNPRAAQTAADMEKQRMENAKKALQQSNENRDRIVQQSEEVVNSRPTPTQEENDLAKLGAHITEHEPDGSPEQNAGPLMASQANPNAAPQQRQSDANKPGSYQNRAMQSGNPQPAQSGDKK